MFIVLIVLNLTEVMSTILTIVRAIEEVKGAYIMLKKKKILAMKTSKPTKTVCCVMRSNYSIRNRLLIIILVLGGHDGIATEEINGEEYKEQGPVEMVEDVFEEEEYPEDCFPPNCYKKFPFLAGDDETPFWLGWGQLRLKTFQLIENKYFETAVITMILLSSLALVRIQILL